MHFYIYVCRGGLPAGLHPGPIGLFPTDNTRTNSSSSPSTVQSAPSNSTSRAATGNIPSSNDPNNYTGAFAQMLNMLSNQNIVCLSKNLTDCVLMIMFHM